PACVIPQGEASQFGDLILRSGPKLRVSRDGSRANKKGGSVTRPLKERRSVTTYACPAWLDRTDGLTPSLLSESSHLCSRSAPKTSSGSAGTCSQPLDTNSCSS